MGNEVYSGVVAIALGLLVGVALFVPFVALSYRRRGGLTVGRFVLWAAALVYFLAIWTYTLLPLPESADFRCAGVNLDLGAFVDDLRGARSITDFAVLQLALNVLLFVPLGFFLRVLGGRGIIVATLVGLGVSLVIETTQLTGVWGIFPCAYRVFDVDDLLTNTVGALVGSLLALAVPRRLRGGAAIPGESGPRPVTRSRRLLAAFCDALGAWLTTAVAGVGTQVWLEYVARDHAAVLDGRLAAVIGAAAPIVAWAVIVGVTGRTVGDIAVELRYRGGPVPEPLARLLRYLGGVGGYLLLGLVPGIGGTLQLAFALASLVLIFTTRGARGLPGLASGRRLADAREGAPGDLAAGSGQRLDAK